MKRPVPKLVFFVVPVFLVIGLLAFALVVPTHVAHAGSPGGTWTATNSMSDARYWDTATLLPSGEVLVAGGVNDITSNGYESLASAELYNPTTGAWATTDSMSVGRYSATATLLPSGKVLVAGGYNIASGQDLTSAELYDPTTGVWTTTGSMSVGRDGHTATLLPSGKVLVAGGYNHAIGTSLSSAELYDPASGTWSPTGSMSTARTGFTATLLPNGEVLAAGGYLPNTATNPPGTAELYDPATGTWSPTQSMSTTRQYQTATLLNTGKVLVAGGFTPTGTPSAELYDPATGTWSPTQSMSFVSAYATATLLQNGEVLVAGGSGGGSGAELYDPLSNTWSLTTSMTTARYEQTATLLPSGEVLVAGGEDSSLNSLASAELFSLTLGSGPQISPLPNSTIMEDNSYVTTGTITDSSASCCTIQVNFGDNTGLQTLPSGTTFSINHLYKEEGTYPVMLTATDTQNVSSTVTATVTVTNAPITVGSIFINPTTPLLAGSTLTTNAAFLNLGGYDTNTASWSWGDNTSSPGAVVMDSTHPGLGTVTGTHTYHAPGLYTVTLTVMDEDHLSESSSYQYVVVYDPAAGFVTGSGTFLSPPGAYLANPSLTGTATFSLSCKYHKGATVPDCSTQMQFPPANLNFQSTSTQWLVVTGAKAEFQGTGTINGTGNYTYLLTVIDGSLPGGGGVNKLRIKIWDTTTGTVVYDTQPGAPNDADPTTVLTGGTIKIHS